MKKNNQNIQNGAELQGRTGPRTDRQILEKHAGVQEKVHGYMKKSKLRRIIAILSAFVLLFTLNTLKFKADTLQHLPMCGLTEHVHSEACYNEAGELVCGLAEHEHTDACYQQRPVQPEPTVFDEFMDLNSQVVLASPMDDEDVNISSENVDEAVGETSLDLDADGADFNAEADSFNGLEVEYDLEDLYDDSGDDSVTVDDVADNNTESEDNADEAEIDYSLDGGSVAFLSDIMKAAGLGISGVTAVGEIVNDTFVEAHISAEPVEGVEDEYVIKVLESFDRVQLGVANADSIETVWLTNGQAVAAAPEASADAAVEDAPAVEEPSEPSEEIVEQDEEIFNSNEIIETEQKQTEVGEIETEVGEADVATDIGETTDAAPAENDESVTGAADASDAQDADDIAVADDQIGDAQDDDTAVADDQTGDTQDDDTAAADDQTGDAQDADDTAVADDQIGDVQDADDTADVEDQQTGDAQDADDTAVVDDQTSDVQDADDTATVDDQTGEAQDDDTAAVDDQAGDDQTGEAAVVKTVTLDFADYNVEDAHTVYLFDAEMGAVLVNTAEIDSVDGVAVTASGEEEAADEASAEEADEASAEEADEASADEGGVLVIEGDGEYALNGTNYVVTGLIIPGKATEDMAQTGDDAQAEDAPADEAPADDAAADGDQPEDDGQAEATVAAQKAVTLDFTDYIATGEHAVYLYDASMVAVLVNEAEIASADGVAVILPEEEAAEADEAQAEDAPAGEAAAEDAQPDAEALIITGDGEYALNGTTYVVTGLVLPEKTVENDNITITTANDEATLLNVAPVFEETPEDSQEYQDIFSLFTEVKDDPKLLAKVFDLLGGVAYAEEDEDGRDLNVRVFRIGLEDVTTGESVEPGTELHVETSLDQPITGEDFSLYHIADGKAELIPDAVVVEDGRAVGLNFNTVSLDKFALVYYTVNVVVEDKNITVGVDFTDVVANGVDFDAETILTALNDGVAIDVASLLAGDADGALSVNVEGDALNVDVDALSVVTAEDGETAEEGVTYADGSVRVTGDGSVVLTDGEYTLNIVVTNYTKLLADRLEAEGVSIEVVEGEVPAGSTVTYETLSADATDALVEAYIPEAAPAPAEEAAPEAAETADSGADEAAAEASGEIVEATGEAAEEAVEAPADATDADQTEDKNEIETATGYTAFDVSIAMPEGDEFTKGGQFAVTVDHAVDAASLVPEGAVIDNITYELFHIHNGEATQIKDVAVANGQVSFTTDGFSEYVIRYTVEFHNGDNEVVIKGGSQVLLSRLIAELGLTRANGESFTVDEVEKVEFVNPELFTVEEVTESPVTVNGEAVELTTAHDFLLTSEQPFDADQMILTMTDGEVIGVDVTDAFMNGQSILDISPLFDVRASGAGQIVNIEFKDNDNLYKFAGNYYVYAGVYKDGKNYVLCQKIDGSTGSVTLNNWRSLKANSGSEGLSLAQGDVIKFYLVVPATNQKPDNTKEINWSYTSNQELNNDAYNLGINEKIGDKCISEVPTVTNGSAVTATVVMADPPKYSASIRFYEANGTDPISNPGISGEYYYLAEVNDSNNQRKFALSANPVNFNSTDSVEFGQFYDQSGNAVSDPTVYNGNPIKVYLVSTNSNGTKPTIPEACGQQNGCTMITPRTEQYGNICTFDKYSLFAPVTGASATITGTKMPAYTVTSSFVGSDGVTSVPNAMSKAYYLVAKQGDKYYIETYDPEKTYEITTFYGQPQSEGSGYNPATYDSTANVNVWLVEKTSTVNSTMAAKDSNNKITGGTVDCYELTCDTSTAGKTILQFVRNSSEVFTSTVKFFSKDATVINAGTVNMRVDPEDDPSELEAPTLSSYYYLLATYVNSVDETTQGWAINPIYPNGKAETSTIFTQFNDIGVDGTQITTKINYQSSSVVKTRLYRSESAITPENLTYKYLVTQGHGIEVPEDGYEFVGNNTTGSNNEIHMRKAEKKSYHVRVRLVVDDSDTIKPILASSNYYVYATINHASGGTSIQFAPLTTEALSTDDNGYQYVDIDFTRFRETTGSLNLRAEGTSNSVFTGNELSIEIKLVKNTNVGYNTSAQQINEGDSLDSYTVHYDTKNISGSQNTISGYHEIWHEDTSTMECYDIIDLVLPHVTNDYDYASILGPNYLYGIVADHLFHGNDLQTNFAVNHYSSHGKDATPDLSGTDGSNAGGIVIGEFNMVSNDKDNNHNGTAITGSTNEDEVWGKLKIGEKVKGTVVVYADNNSGYNYETHGSIVDDSKKAAIIWENGESLMQNIVQPNINYGISVSNALASHTATMRPAVSGNSIIVDTTGLEDNTTIYIDIDDFLTVEDATESGLLKDNNIGGYGNDHTWKTYKLSGLKIKKLDNQMIVFNFKEKQNVTISQFYVDQPAVQEGGAYSSLRTDGFGFKTETETSAGPQNEFMDDLSRHIVWNLHSCTGRVTLSNVGGIFLEPNHGSELDIQHTSGGWIVSNGFVFNSDGEWHNFFAGMPDNSSVNLVAAKTVDGKVPTGNQIFKFELYEYDKDGTPSNWVNRLENTNSVTYYTGTGEQTNIVKATGSVGFTIPGPLTTGWHVYRIHEMQEVPTQNNGRYIYDTNDYYAAVYVQTITDANNTPHIVVSDPKYYRQFTGDDFQPMLQDGTTPNPVLTGFSEEFRLSQVTFKNEEQKTGLTLEKKVNGTDKTDTEFTFEIKVWQEPTEGTKTALDAEAKPYALSGLDGQTTITLTPVDVDGGNVSKGTLVLRNGQRAVIQGLPVSAHYSIEETKVGAKLISEYQDANGYVDHYKPHGQNPVTGTLDGEGSAVVIFQNDYDAGGALKITKAVTEGCNADGTPFTFQVALTPAEGVTIDTGNLKLNDSGIISGDISENGNVVTVTVRINGAGSATLSNIPVGTTYEVTETELPGWEQQGTVYKDGVQIITANVTNEVTVTNKEITEFEFTKQWRGSTTSNKTWPKRPNGNDGEEDVPIEITLKRRLPPAENPFNPKVKDERFSFTYTVTSAGATPTGNSDSAPKVTVSGTAPVYTFSMDGLQKYGSFTKTVDGTQTEYSGEFEYYVVETPMDFYNTTYLANNNDASTAKHDAMNGEIVRNTELQTYELPSTGGHGTGIFYILGSVLTLLAAVLLITKRRSGSAE